MLKTWKPKLIKGFTMIICASRRSGKTIFTKFLTLYKGGLLDSSDIILVMTSGVNKNAYNFISPDNIITGYQPEVINDILDQQDETKKEIELATYYDNKKKPELPTITIILDDCIEFRTRYDRTLERLFFQGRHYNINLLFITQSLSCISPSFLRNCDYFVYFKFYLKNDRKKVTELLGLYSDEETIKKILDLKVQYQLYIFDLLSDETELTDKLYKFIVPLKFVKL